MLIDCPGCANSYHVSRATLEPHGRTVVCPRCATSWYVAAQGGDIATADRGAKEISTEAISQRLVSGSRAADAVPRKRLREDPAFPRISLSRLSLFCLLPLALLMAGIGYRSQIVRFWPEAASAYEMIGLPVNLRGLALHDVHATLTDAGAEPVLGVEGRITNLKSGKNLVTPLRLSLRDAEGRELYVWVSDAPKANVAAGETITFRARLAAPPTAAYSLLVSFAPAARDHLALQQ